MARRDRRSAPRARTENVRNLTMRDVEASAAQLVGALALHAETERPRTRAECREGERPCPWVGCRFHLYLDVTEAGSLKLNHPNLEPWEMPWSCALDEAELGGMSLDEVGRRMNFTLERTRQVEVKASIQMGARIRELEHEEES